MTTIIMIVIHNDNKDHDHNDNNDHHNDKLAMTLMILSPSTLRTSSCCGATTSAPPSTGYMDSMMSVSCPRTPHCRQCHRHYRHRRHHQLDISKMSVTHHHFNINDHCHHCSNFSSQNPPIDLLIIVIDEPPQRPLRIWV